MSRISNKNASFSPPRWQFAGAGGHNSHTMSVPGLLERADPSPPGSLR